MFKHMKVRSKMLTIIFVPFVGLFTISLLASASLTSVSDELKKVLHDEAYTSTSLLLNADRDFYQADMDRIKLQMSNTKTAQASFEENVTQTRERVGEAIEIIAASNFKDMKHAETDRTILESAELFNSGFELWVKGAEQNEYSEDLNAQFEVTRGYMNEMQEIIEIGMIIHMEMADDNVSSAKKLTWIIGAIALIVSACAAFYFSKDMIRLIRSISHNIKQIALGDLTVSKINWDSRDEIGQLIHGLNTMTDSLKNIISHIQESAEQLAASSEQLNAGAQQTSHATEDIATSASSIAASTKEQTDKLVLSRIKTEQVTDKIQQIADLSSLTLSKSQNTDTSVVKGVQHIRSVEEQMYSISRNVIDLSAVAATLGESSKEIQKIVDIIGGVSKQTNLLALNAGIEAARAGEHGKGFAVVANEVKKLAEQTSEHTESISNLITYIQSGIDRAVDSADSSTREVKDGSEKVKSTGEFFADIKDSTDTMGQQILVVTEAANQINEISRLLLMTIEDVVAIANMNTDQIHTVAAATEEQLASMQEISSSASHLSSIADNLKDSVSKFKV